MKNIFISDKFTNEGGDAMHHTRFIQSSGLTLALVLAGFAGGCGSREPPVTGPPTGVVVNGVPQIDDTGGKGKRYMYDPKGAAKAAKAAAKKAKGGAPGP
jgi:hypothetical protein